MTLSDAATRDLINAISDVPIDFTWSGADYTGTRGALITTKSYNEGGFLEEPELSITTTLKKLDAAGNLVNRFPSGTPPALGNTLTVDSVVYRITKMHRDELSAGIQFDLSSKNKGA